jgi:hypothetical protein
MGPFDDFDAQDFARIERQLMRDRDLLQKTHSTLVLQKPLYQTRTIPGWSGFFLITFIGGPFNASQRQLDGKRFDVKQGEVNYFLPLERPMLNLSSLNEQDKRIEQYPYRLTFIPQSETPFTDDICVVGLYV